MGLWRSDQSESRCKGRFRGRVKGWIRVNPSELDCVGNGRPAFAGAQKDEKKGEGKGGRGAMNQSKSK